MLQKEGNIILRCIFFQYFYLLMFMTMSLTEININIYRLLNSIVSANILSVDLRLQHVNYICTHTYACLPAAWCHEHTDEKSEICFSLNNFFSLLFENIKTGQFTAV